MSLYERVACSRTQGSTGCPETGSRYSGWCMCQRKTTRAKAASFSP